MFRTSKCYIYCEESYIDPADRSLGVALAGRCLRFMARRPEYLRPRAPEGTEIVAADVLDLASLAAGGSFREQDRMGARHFGEAARAAGVRRIVYLGGLGDPSAPLSSHLRSRQ